MSLRSKSSTLISLSLIEDRSRSCANFRLIDGCFNRQKRLFTRRHRAFSSNFVSSRDRRHVSFTASGAPRVFIGVVLTGFVIVAALIAPRFHVCRKYCGRRVVDVRSRIQRRRGRSAALLSTIRATTPRRSALAFYTAITVIGTSPSCEKETGVGLAKIATPLKRGSKGSFISAVGETVGKKKKKKRPRTLAVCVYHRGRLFKALDVIHERFSFCSTFKYSEKLVLRL